MNLFSGQEKYTKWALCITFILSAIAMVGLLTDRFKMWPVVAVLCFHGIWIAIAYRKKVKISKEGLEFEEDEEDQKP